MLHKPPYATAPAAYPHSDPTPCLPLQARVANFISKQAQGLRMLDQLRAHAAFRNPTFLQQCVQNYQIQQYGSALATQVFDPAGLAPEDYYDELCKQVGARAACLACVQVLHACLLLHLPLCALVACHLQPVLLRVCCSVVLPGWWSICDVCAQHGVAGLQRASCACTSCQQHTGDSRLRLCACSLRSSSGSGRRSARRSSRCNLWRGECSRQQQRQQAGLSVSARSSRLRRSWQRSGPRE